jgi:hypothetical protein
MSLQGCRRKRTRIYHQIEAWNRIDSKNSLSYVDAYITVVENENEGVVGPRNYTSKCVTMGHASYFHTTV